MSFLSRVEAKQRDLSHLPAENQIVERTDSVIRWVNRLLFDAEKALKPRRKVKQGLMTDEVKKLLAEVDLISSQASRDIKKVRETLDAFMSKHSDLKEIPF